MNTEVKSFMRANRIVKSGEICVVQLCRKEVDIPRVLLLPSKKRQLNDFIKKVESTGWIFTSRNGAKADFKPR